VYNQLTYVATCNHMPVCAKCDTPTWMWVRGRARGRGVAVRCEARRAKRALTRRARRAARNASQRKKQH
jgi:hypothetical protein